MDKFLIIAVALVSTSIDILADDFIVCKREKTVTRQFCEISSSIKQREITLPRETTVNGVSFKLADILRNQSVDILSSKGQERLNFRGLNPILKMSLDWNTSPDCSRSDLWRDRITLNLFSDSSNIVGSLVNPGRFDFEIDLYQLSSTSGEVWETFEDDTNVTLAVNYGLINQDAAPSRPLASQRIPKECKLLVENDYLGYDNLDIAQDLAILKTLVNSKNKLMIQSEVIHAQIIGGQKGAVCSLHNLGQALRSAELLFKEDSWDKLSISSQDTISLGMAEAVSQGAIDISSVPILDGVPDFYSYFTSDDFQTDSKNACTQLGNLQLEVSPDFFVSEDGKVLNQFGYSNALSFELEKTNLYTLLSVSWALFEAGKFEIENNQELEWLINSGLYLNLSDGVSND